MPSTIAGKKGPQSDLQPLKMVEGPLESLCMSPKALKNSDTIDTLLVKKISSTDFMIFYIQVMSFVPFLQMRTFITAL